MTLLFKQQKQKHQCSILTMLLAKTLAHMIARQQTSMLLICIPLVTLTHSSQATMVATEAMLISNTDLDSPQNKHKFTTHQKPQLMNCKQERITSTNLYMTSRAEPITGILTLCTTTSTTLHTKDSTDLLIITIKKRETTFLYMTVALMDISPETPT